MEELVEKAKKGNKEAFARLIIMFRDDFYKIARMRLKRECDIEDAVQEAMITSYCCLNKLRHSEYFKTWFIKILINKCNKIYNKGKRESLFNDEICVENNLEYIKGEEIEHDIDFYLLISNLNYDERIAMILFYGVGYTTKEISKILNVKENTLKSRISRGREKIKEILKEVHYNG